MHVPRQVKETLPSSPRAAKAEALPKECEVARSHVGARDGLEAEQALPTAAPATETRKGLPRKHFPDSALEVTQE